MHKKSLPPSRDSLFDEFKKRKNLTQDNHRKEAINKRHSKGKRSARENIEDLCDSESFQEIGSLVIAAQKRRKSHQELKKNTPADGLITGIGKVNADQVAAEKANCYILSYDYTVLAGTQGGFGHKKTDRIMTLATKINRPIIFFVEGGGGRPGDVDFDLVSTAGLDLSTWASFARLSGKVPRIAIASGYCFAGNAALAGCADIIIATQDSSMGMAGPAMISGGGMGEYHPKEIGPASSLFQNGVIDLLVENEKEAISVAKQYLSYFQGPLEKGKVVDQKKLRTLLPQDRKYAYDIMKIIHTLADENSVLELRGGFAKNLVTCLARIEGKSIGIIANNTRYLGGAIDSEGADKASRFMQLCNAFNFPLVSLCDTPGFMVGPADEAKGLIRHSGRLFINAAALNIPQITIILRKAYGLGAMAMAGGGFHESYLTLAWPTGEFGAMGLEGAVKLGFKSELEKIQNPENKEKHFNELVEKEYEKGKSINAAESLEFDEVIDPAETRNRIITALATVTNTINHSCSSRFIDGW